VRKTTPPSHICHICGVVLFTICQHATIPTLSLSLSLSLSPSLLLSSYITCHYAPAIVRFNVRTPYPTNPTCNDELNNLSANWLTSSFLGSINLASFFFASNYDQRPPYPFGVQAQFYNRNWASSLLVKLHDQRGDAYRKQEM